MLSVADATFGGCRGKKHEAKRRRRLLGNQQQHVICACGSAGAAWHIDCKQMQWAHAHAQATHTVLGFVADTLSAEWQKTPGTVGKRMRSQIALRMRPRKPCVPPCLGRAIRASGISCRVKRLDGVAPPGEPNHLGLTETLTTAGRPVIALVRPSKCARSGFQRGRCRPMRMT